MYVRALALVIVVIGCAARAPVVRPPTTGAIIGLVRDAASGDPIAMAQIRVRADGQLAPRATTSGTDGTYDVDHLRPGRYALTAHFAGDVVEVANIEIVAGRATPVDVAFELGRATPLLVDYGDPRAGAIDRYRPKAGDPTRGTIEGTVSDVATRERVVGAVITALGERVAQTRQTVTDEQGRFRFHDLPPGTYSVSAYYTVTRRGQIEVLRNGLDVRGGEAVVVPLFLELEQ